MFTGADIPYYSVVASHLFKFKFRHECKYQLSIDDINDERNGLLLLAPIEHAFDRSHITFVYDKELQKFKLKLLKQDLKQVTFRKYAKTERNINTNMLFKQSASFTEDSKKRYVDTLHRLLDRTFGDFEGVPFAYNFTASKKCFYRCFAFQQAMATLQAKENGWISEDEADVLPCMWSDLEEEKVKTITSWIKGVFDSKGHEIELI